MRKSATKLIVFSIILLLVIFGYNQWTSNPVATPYVSLERQDALETITATGRIFGKDKVHLSYPMAGIIDTINVSQGDMVEKGDVLLILENSSQKNLIKQRETAYNRAQANLNKISTTDIFQAEENVKQAKLAYDSAYSNYERSLELYQFNGISEVELENSDRLLKLAESNLSLSQSNLESASGNMLKIGSLAVEQEKGLLEDALSNYEKTYLKAPVKGKIIEQNAGLGEYIQTGQKLISFLPMDTDLYIECQIDEEFISRVAPGQEAYVVSSAYTGEVFSAKVSQIAPQVDDLRGTIQVKLKLDKENLILPNNATVSVQIITGKQEDVLVLEKRLIRKNDNGFFVYIESKGRAEIQYIEVEDIGNGRLIILEGIDENAKVLISTDLKEGQMVTLSSAKE